MSQPATAAPAEDETRAQARPVTAATAPEQPGLTPLDPGSLIYRRRIARPGSRQHGQRQRWGAVSADRVWLYRRAETAGTPWHIQRLRQQRRIIFDVWVLAGHVIVLPAERVVERAEHQSVIAPSLAVARAWTASGYADHLLDEQARAAALPRCTWRSALTASICTRPATPDGRCTNPHHALAVAS